MAKIQNGKEMLPKISTPLSMVHEHYRRQTDRRKTDLRYQRPERNVVTFG